MMCTMRFSWFPTHRDTESSEEADGLGLLLDHLGGLGGNDAIYAPVAVG